MNKIVLEDFNEGNGYYKVNLAYLNKKQVEEIEALTSTWNPTDEDIKSCIGMCLTDANEQRFKDYNTNLKDCLTWLKKQGKQKPQGKSALEAIKEEKVDNANKVEPKDYNSIDPHFGKPIDKVEPKFKIGDWITDGYLHCKISDVLDDRYIVDTKFGKRSAIPFKRENNYHLWSIQDAKDGDILIYNDSIFIFDEIYENDLIYYGIYEHNKFHNDKYYSFLDLNTININNIYPATKEQRDTLERAMTDAGYTFDFEKKELKKIEESENIKEISFNSEKASEEYIAWLKSLKQRIGG